ncbi:MAG: hypothetical protein LH702_01160 [Phormidesmis sp. CAN_BIN44]|nr:hypothetical protein [Phormidesmis sp. CAN_BIN44]
MVPKESARLFRYAWTSAYLSAASEPLRLNITGSSQLLAIEVFALP